MRPELKAFTAVCYMNGVSEMPGHCDMPRCYLTTANLVVCGNICYRNVMRLPRLSVNTTFAFFFCSCSDAGFALLICIFIVLYRPVHM